MAAALNVVTFFDLNSFPKAVCIKYQNCDIKGFECRRLPGGQPLRRRKPSSLGVKCSENSQPSQNEVERITQIRRADFKSDFMFGASTSALQTEGNLNVGGRLPSTWDPMVMVEDGFNGTDSYNMYKDDVKALKDMNMNFYRFSISWSRILPYGHLKGGVNEEGVKFYNNLINELIANGITPLVTIMHFEIPEYLAKSYSSVLKKEFIDDFRDYASLCFERFGDRVKHWATINEPFNVGAYMWKPYGVSGEGDPRDGAFKATHNVILAHATAVDIYRKNFKEQGGEIGISLSFNWTEQFSEEAAAAAQKARDYHFGWYMDPLTYGEYPEIMRQEMPELPVFTDEQKELVKGSFDWVGINYYETKYGKQADYWTVDDRKGHLRQQFVEQTASDAENNQMGPYGAPDGLRKVLLYIKEKYENPKVVITENGLAKSDVFNMSLREALDTGNKEVIDLALADESRLIAIQQHLAAVLEAKSEGANVQGYCVWSLLDSMEPAQGYDVRMGLYFTDYYDYCKRYPKTSGKWFTKFLNPALSKTPYEVPQDGLSPSELAPFTLPPVEVPTPTADVATTTPPAKISSVSL